MSDRQARARQAMKSNNNQARRGNVITAGVIIFIVALIIGGAVWSIQGRRADQNAVSNYPKEKSLIVPKDSTADYGILYKPSDAGNATANADSEVRAHIVIFEDFSCPYCEAFETAYGGAVNDLVKSGKADVEYRIVSFLDESGRGNNYSRRAASASLVVRDNEGMAGWKKYHDYLYAHQPAEGVAGPSDLDLLNDAKKLGFTVSRDHVLSERYVPWVLKGTKVFDKTVGSTPTIMVNGTKVDATIQAIDAAVNKAYAA